MTLGEKLDRNRGIGGGFDQMRVILAFLVVALHSSFVVERDSLLEYHPIWWLPVYMVLPAFFALSGFLVASSAVRLSMKNFIINRGMRMLPALCVETVISAFILGALFTTLPLDEYFTSVGLWRYFLNIVGMIQYELPGVFVGLPSDGIVNLSLWTIGWEYACYTIICLLIVTGGFQRYAPVLLVAGAYGLGAVATQAFHLQDGSSAIAAGTRFLFDGESTTRLMFPCLLGIAAFKFRHKIPYTRAAAALAVAWCVVVAVFVPERWLYQPVMAVIVGPPLVYLVLALGVTTLPRLPLFSRGDYSYGIYLYSYPIQQSVKALMPWIEHAALLTLIAFPIVALFAAFSWHVIEKPVLKVRQRYSFAAKIRLRAEADAAGAATEPANVGATAALGRSPEIRGPEVRASERPLTGAVGS